MHYPPVLPACASQKTDSEGIKHTCRQTQLKLTAMAIVQNPQHRRALIAMHMLQTIMQGNANSLLWVHLPWPPAPPAARPPLPPPAASFPGWSRAAGPEWTGPSAAVPSAPSRSPAVQQRVFGTIESDFLINIACGLFASPHFALLQCNSQSLGC